MRTILLLIVIITIKLIVNGESDIVNIMNNTNNINITINDTVIVKLNGVYRIDSLMRGYKLTANPLKIYFRNSVHNVNQNFRITEKNTSLYTIESVSYKKDNRIK